MPLRDRLSKLEERVSAGTGLTIVRIEGGLPDLEVCRAQAGSHSCVQKADESKGAFETRVVAFAEAAGVRTVTFGGLPA